MTKKNLTMTPSAPVWTDADTIIFDRKFYDGMLVFLDAWPGSIHCILRQSNGPFPDFGMIRKKANDLPFELTILQDKEKRTREHLKDASIVFAAGDDFDQLHLSATCKEMGVKCVYAIEYIPETRYQIVDFETRNPILRWRRHFYIWNGERKRRAAFQLADGIQANGVAAFDEYKDFKNSMLYFDTRINKNIIIHDTELKRRLTKLQENQPLRLAFSGRLVKMKGADHLIRLATILKARNIHFHLTIYGTGALENSMREEIRNEQLENEVHMAGPVDFYKELIPEIKESIDLYIIMHRQSDPSCTYLETTSCGIPIVGYENRAFTGLLKFADVGWGRPVDDVDGIADVIEQISNKREDIVQKSKNCAVFSRQHDFESTFQKRMEHLRQIVTL